MRKLTSNQRQSLQEKLSEYAYKNELNFVQVEDLVNLFTEWSEAQQSFSELIIGKNDMKKTCNTCGQLCVAYKTFFRKTWIKPLQILHNVERPMTMKEIAELMLGKTTVNDAITRTLPQAQHWNVLEKMGNSQYKITEKGVLFLKGEAALPEFIWIPARNAIIVTPENGKDITINELQDRDYSDKSIHIIESFPSLK